MFVCSWKLSHFRSLRAGSQVFSLLTLFLCVIFHTMSLRKSMQFLCILELFGVLCLFCHQNDVWENSIGSVYVVRYGGLSEIGLFVIGKLCPVGFLVVFLMFFSFVAVYSHVVC